MEVAEFILNQIAEGKWALLFLVISLFLLWILVKQYVKSNQVKHNEHYEHHEENQEVFKILKDNLVELKNMTSIHKSEIADVKGDIVELKLDIRESRQKKTR